MLRLQKPDIRKEDGSTRHGGYVWVNPETAHLETFGEGDQSVMVHCTWVSFHVKGEADQIAAWLEEARHEEFLLRQKALLGMKQPNGGTGK